MDTFFNGLDGRLRVSGMVADSIMMGIVNSAMEDAYKKSCTKEGDLERLNEKSRFCELAIMQLEWCLKYLQEETNKSILDDDGDRDELLYDLLETRDRIHHRLEETELAIAEKDRELLERREVEVDLRLALELKDVDIQSLHAALGIEREKIERASKSFQCKRNITGKKGVYAINDVKDGVERQTQKLKGKLEERKKNLIEMLKGQDSSRLNSGNLEHRFDNDMQARLKLNHERFVCVIGQMILELDELLVDVDVLKEKIDMSFKTMANSLSSFKAVMNEKHWTCNFEKETINIITGNFVKDTQNLLENDLRAPKEDVRSDFYNLNWSNVIGCIWKLNDKTDILAYKIKTQSHNALNYPPVNMELNTLLQSKGSNGACVSSLIPAKNGDESNVMQGNGSPQIDGIHVHVRAESHKVSSMLRKACSAVELSKQSSIVDLIYKGAMSNHEHIILQKAWEINKMVCDLTEGKKFLATSNTNSHYYVGEILAGAILMLDFLIEEKITFSTICDDQIFCHDSLSRFCQHEQSSSKPCCKLAHTDLHDDRRQFEQQNFDFGFHLMISSDIHKIFFKGLFEMIHADESIKVQINENLFKICLSQTYGEWGYYKETCKIEMLITEEIYFLVSTTVLKSYMSDLSCTTEHGSLLGSGNSNADLIHNQGVVTRNDEPNANCQIHFVLPLYAKISQQLEEFELTVHDKMCLNMERCLCLYENSSRFIFTRTVAHLSLEMQNC